MILSNNRDINSYYQKICSSSFSFFHSYRIEYNFEPLINAINTRWNVSEMAKSWIGILKKRIGSCQEQAEASDPPWIERRRSTSSHEHKELLHLRGLVHEVCAFSHATSESGLLWGGGGGEGEGRRAEQEADNQIIEISFCNSLTEWDNFSRCLRGKIVAYNLGSASDSTCFLFHCFASNGNSVFQVFFNRAILIYNYAISSNFLSRSLSNGFHKVKDSEDRIDRISFNFYLLTRSLCFFKLRSVIESSGIWIGYLTWLLNTPNPKLETYSIFFFFWAAWKILVEKVNSFSKENCYTKIH